MLVTELSNVSTNWIYQSNRFIEASFYLTANEQKILRILASMISKDDNEFKEYNFKVSELAKLIGCNEKNAYRDLERISDTLMTRFIKVKNKSVSGLCVVTERKITR